ncbi:MAG TPA: endonuclease Q family protein [Candidatus Magasanikbacteria bacterium]|nr:endonuclease Q family protein [Candidatus Magasanikbacteria bacterium]
MIQKILDLHTHSKYSRACSKDLELPKIAKACEIRGIDIVSTSDFTHPKWFDHMKSELIEDTEGVYKLKNHESKTRFIIGTEIASIKKHADQTRRVHLLVFSPSLEVTEKFNKTLEDRGFNIRSDGRPIIGLTSKQILELMLEIDPRMKMIPAHAWTPWFGIFGSKGGYNSLNDAFEDLTPHIHAIETGLSSDPLMNWRWSHLDNITLISNSDAHSLQKLGREANVLQFNSVSEVTYTEIMRVIEEGDKNKFVRTIEFYPEEGKYHYDGHRDCGFYCAPEETKKRKGICPVCGKNVTIGVEYRVHELADRTIDEARNNAAQTKRIPFTSLVPLPEIIADVYEMGVSSKKVTSEYESLINHLGSEFHILIHASLDEIQKVTNETIARAIERVRIGNIFIRPGYDGEFGVVKVFKENESRGLSLQSRLGLE